jgi:hypothetical protein
MPSYKTNTDRKPLDIKKKKSFKYIQSLRQKLTLNRMNLSYNDIKLHKLEKTFGKSFVPIQRKYKKSFTLILPVGVFEPTIFEPQALAQYAMQHLHSLIYHKLNIDTKASNIHHMNMINS